MAQKNLSIPEYVVKFPESVRAEALKVAHDSRKFEIELYWKRATYFWTIIGVAFAGFFALGREATAGSVFTGPQVGVACLGLVVSIGWYMVNRGSTAWQRNWEIQVDLLEDAITGPLHKVYATRGVYVWWDLFGPFSFSPAKVNAILSLFIVGVWMGIVGSSLLPFRFPIAWEAGLAIYALCAIVILGVFGRKGDLLKDRPVQLKIREL